jgi:hypothetical protein
MVYMIKRSMRYSSYKTEHVWKAVRGLKISGAVSTGTARDRCVWRNVMRRTVRILKFASMLRDLLLSET